MTRRSEEQIDGLHVVHALPDEPRPGRPALLLVHGSCHGAWCWEHWLEALPTAGWAAHALSLRGHPPSTLLAEGAFCRDVRLADYADDVARVAGQLTDPLVVVGHSMGGITSQLFAQRWVAAGASLAALVLLTPVPPAPFMPLREVPMPTDRPFLPTAEQVAGMFFHDVEPAVLAWTREHICPESPAIINEYSLRPGVAIDPAGLPMPKLVLTAGHDGTPVPRDRGLADFLGADYAHFANMGHDLMLERNWRAVLDQVLDWLAPLRAE